MDLSLVQRSREMSQDLNVLGTHTVQLFTINGLTKVVGVIDDVKRDALIRYIDFKGGEKENDWYRFLEDKDLLDVVNKAKDLDPKAEVYNIDVGSR